jgi:adenosylhomocysteinase
VSAVARSRIADLSLAPLGEQRIAWVERHSPVLNRLARRMLADGALRGRRLAVVVHLEAKTAYLATILAEAGATVVMAGSNPGTTQDPVCAALVARGIEVHATHSASPEEFEADLLAAIDTRPEIVIDDGAELTLRLLAQRPGLVGDVAGVTEETTTGVARLRELQKDGRLSFPAIAANDAACKHLFDNRFGTGQTTLTAIDRLTNLQLSGKTICVIGYGWVGRGIARYALGLGARVVVSEVDPVAALEAHAEGHHVAALDAALPRADVVITATGVAGALGPDAFPLLRDGVVLANAGHDDCEIDVTALRAAAAEARSARPAVEEICFPDGRRAYLLVEGRLVNIAGGDGHPVEIMDLSFSVQALAAHLLASTTLAPGLHPFPAELDSEIARTKLATLGIEL